MPLFCVGEGEGCLYAAGAMLVILALFTGGCMVSMVVEGEVEV